MNTTTLEATITEYIETLNGLFEETDADRAEELNSRAVELGIAIAGEVGADTDRIGVTGGDPTDWEIPGAVACRVQYGQHAGWESTLA